MTRQNLDAMNVKKMKALRFVFHSSFHASFFFSFFSLHRRVDQFESSEGNEEEKEETRPKKKQRR